MEKIPMGCEAKPTAKAVYRLLFPYNDSIKTITTDNGCEFAAHWDIANGRSRKGQEKVTVYFADPYCS